MLEFYDYLLFAASGPLALLFNDISLQVAYQILYTHEWRLSQNCSARKIVVSSVDLVEGSGVSKTAVPYFIYNLLCMGFILACWPCSYRQDRSSSNTLLMLLCELPLAPPEELARPPTFTAEGACSNLVFCVSQWLPISGDYDLGRLNTSVQAACRRLFIQSTLNLRWS